MSSPSMCILTMVLPKNRTNIQPALMPALQLDIQTQATALGRSLHIQTRVCSLLPVSLSCTLISGTGINRTIATVRQTNTGFSKYYSQVFSSFGLLVISECSTHIPVPRNLLQTYHSANLLGFSQAINNEYGQSIKNYF